MHALKPGAGTHPKPQEPLLNESELIEAARGGDADAFAMLFREYRPRLFLVARRYFAPGSDRDDLIQEATIGFYKAIRDFKGDRGSFSSFAELCVRRQVITFIKNATRRKHGALNWAVSLNAPAYTDSDEELINRIPAPATNLDVDSDNFDSDNVEFLSTLWDRCSRLERGILSMYARGFSFFDMARELGVNNKSIDNAVWRVKVKAKKLLADQPLELS